MNDNGIVQVNSIFEQPWWLEAVAPGQWAEVTVEKDGKIQARLPYYRYRQFGFPVLGMPDYTQSLGYWIEETGAKNARKYAREKELITELIDQLPKRANLKLDLDHKCDYLFPLVWKGCKIQMAYSYRLDDLHDMDALWNGLADNIKREIRKAEKILTVEADHPIDDLLSLQEKTFKRQGRSSKGKEQLVRRLDNVLLQKNARKLLCAVDGEGRIHAASYFVFDKKCCFFLIGGGDPQLRTSGASSLLMWEGIKFASGVSEAFDFEGSMIEPIERFFRAFGGVPTPYWRVTKLNPVLSLAEYMKPKIKKLLGWK